MSEHVTPDETRSRTWAHGEGRQDPLNRDERRSDQHPDEVRRVAVRRDADGAR